MKVLMFGWEFPPHISGGLGTACHGLTEALGNEAVRVLFVVPTLRGGETLDNGRLINASKVIVQTDQLTVDDALTELGQDKHLVALVQKGTPPVKPVELDETNPVVVIKVSSSIVPYTETIVQPTFVKTRRWNYVFPDEFDADTVFPAPDMQPESDKAVGVSYDFTVVYGPSLLDEVDKYALVARTISAQHEFDVIHAHDWLTFKAGVEAKKISGKPLILHVHATEYDRAGEQGDPVVSTIERDSMLAADLIIAVSDRTKSIAVREYNIPEEKIQVVHNGVVIEDKVKSSYTVPLGSHVITFLGRITYQKGPIYFIEAARKVLQEFPDAHFVMAGAGDLLPVVIERVAALRLSNNFHFTGFVKGEQIAKIWSISDVYVMPSVSEPFGITPLEAIQAGVPVIISNQSGVGEVMPHAMKVDFWNTQALADAICSVLQYKSLSNTLKQNSTNEIKKITWNKAAKKIKRLYYELSGNTRHSS